jgi:hypothetical protein
MSEVLYGVHDEEASSGFLKPDEWCLGLVELSQNPGGKSYRSELNWLLRMNWGYGSTGTLPDGSLFPYLKSLVGFAQSCKGATRFIIGNEPNHPQEWPNGKQISAKAYADAFIASYKALKAVDSSFSVIPAAIAPYREGWLDYLVDVFENIRLSGINPDGIAIHAYLRSADPAQVSDEGLQALSGPLKGTYWGFLTYRDVLSHVPAAWKGVPAYITEIDEDLPDGWVDLNTGVVKAVYEEINSWNQRPETQKIHAGILYRWPKYDKFYLVGKLNALQDFTEASEKGYKAPNSLSDGGSSVFIPEIENSGSTGQNLSSDANKPVIDPRATARGVKVEQRPGTEWRVKSVRWLDKQESQGRHHIYFDTLDEAGNRLANVPIVIDWPTNSYVTRSEEKKGEPWDANYPMSPSRNEYSVWVGDSPDHINSDIVSGIGMGADLGGGFNAGEHTST